MRTLINRIGPCDLVPRRGAFAILCHSIISQQLSIAAATTIFDRLVNLYPARRLTPMAVLSSTTPSLRAAGLSQQKIRYVQGLALAFQMDVLNRGGSRRNRMKRLSPALTRIKGIGRWTVEMFLIFSLNRPDVLPVESIASWYLWKARRLLER